MTEPKDRSAIVLPFGKHKGSTVAELLVRDPAYAEWIVAQGWVAERFAELHAAILTRGAGSDDSPEHNAIQVRFLDPEFQFACVLAARRDYPEIRSRFIERRISDLNHYLERLKEGRIYNGRFLSSEEIIAEHARTSEELNLFSSETRHVPTIKAVYEDRGVDITLSFRFDGYREDVIRIEIKPTMGDDYPTVMRQMQRLGCGMLVLGEYTGRAVSEPQLRQMFEANGRTLLFIRDIEAEIPNARAELA